MTQSIIKNKISLVLLGLPSNPGLLSKIVNVINNSPIINKPLRSLLLANYVYDEEVVWKEIGTIKAIPTRNPIVGSKVKVVITPFDPSLYKFDGVSLRYASTDKPFEDYSINKYDNGEVEISFIMPDINIVFGKISMKKIEE